VGGTAARSSRTNLRDIENVVDECQDLGGALLDHRDLLHTTCLSLLVQHLTHAQDTCIDENMRESERASHKHCTRECQRTSQLNANVVRGLAQEVALQA